MLSLFFYSPGAYLCYSNVQIVEDGGLVGHGGKIAEVKMAHPVRQVHAPVTVVVGTGSLSRQEHGTSIVSSNAQAGSTHGAVLEPGLQPDGVTVEVIVGHIEKSGVPTVEDVAVDLNIDAVQEVGMMTDQDVAAQPPGQGSLHAWLTVTVDIGVAHPHGRLVVETARHSGSMHVEQ